MADHAGQRRNAKRDAVSVPLHRLDESDAIEDMQKQARKNWERRAKRMGIKLQEPEAKIKKTSEEDDTSSSSSPEN